MNLNVFLCCEDRLMHFRVICLIFLIVLYFCDGYAF